MRFFYKGQNGLFYVMKHSNMNIFTGITGEKRRRALYSPMECDAFTAWRDSKGDSVTWRSVAAGQHHSLALDGAGSVLALGRCEYGRLGLPQPEDAQHLTIIPALQHRNVVSISASTSSSFAVTAEGQYILLQSIYI
ncbi:hypothetical protein O3G_MSEX000927 [Manduca sexta]|nr:hypothetical protein O3G_MSEX000927 [Manduca sexta]